MYLSPDLADGLDLRFDELSPEYRREHGEKMTKNDDFISPWRRRRSTTRHSVRSWDLPTTAIASDGVTAFLVCY